MISDEKALAYITLTGIVEPDELAAAYNCTQFVALRVLRSLAAKGLIRRYDRPERYEMVYRGPESAA